MNKILLIIEDEYTIAINISMALQKLGYIIFTSSSSKKALEALKIVKIDLILTIFNRQRNRRIQSL